MYTLSILVSQLPITSNKISFRGTVIDKDNAQCYYTTTEM